MDSSIKLSVQSAVTVAEANTQVYKNGIENGQYYVVLIHGPVLFEMLFGCDHLYASKYKGIFEVGKEVRDWREKRTCGEWM